MSASLFTRVIQCVQENVRTLKPSHDPRAAMRDAMWWWLSQSLALEEEWRSAQWRKPGRETVPKWFGEVKQTHWLTRTVLHDYCEVEKAKRGSFMAQTQLKSLFTCNKAWDLNVTDTIRTLNLLSKFEYHFPLSDKWKDCVNRASDTCWCENLEVNKKDFQLPWPISCRKLHLGDWEASPTFSETFWPVNHFLTYSFC